MRTRPSTGLTATLLAAALPFASACGDLPTGPGPDLEVVVAGGDRQYGLAGQRLESSLEALVRRADTGAHQEGVEVEWSVAQGDASLSTSRVTTDQNGYARVSVTLGTRRDTVRIRASVRVQPTASAVFEAYVAEQPVLASLSVTSARAGDTITLAGGGFSPSPVQNVVLFSGIRGRVTEATATRLAVEIPPCLPGRLVSVTTQLGGLVSTALPLSVQDAGRITPLDPGEYIDVDESAGIGCLRLSGGGARYLVMAMSAGTVGAARYGFVLRGLGTSADAGAMRTPALEAGPSPVVAAPFAARWEAALRSREEFMVRTGPRSDVPSAAARVTEPVPSVGDRRSFKVLNAESKFDDVTAVARVVSDQAVVYLDETAPAGGYTDADLQEFTRAFDDVIYPTDTEAFGFPSDLDGNGRIVILFTPTVNRLTPRKSDSFVGGFFYGLDLLPEREGSNRGEIFYALVPDSAGIFSDPREKKRILEVVPAILAHEFQHMIHFNERVIRLKADRSEALWLSEGLAQMAEELVGRAYVGRGEYATAARFQEGNTARARLYLAAPESVSLIVSTGQGSLQERGAGWLFMLYLWDRDAAGDVLGRLTRSSRTGTQNVSWVTGRPWRDLLADWMAAIYLDGLGEVPYRFEYPTVNLRNRLRTTTAPYPLDPPVLSGSDFGVTGSLWSSSVKHYIVVPPSAGSVALRLGGEAGANAPADAALRLRVVRLF